MLDHFGESDEADGVLQTYGCKRSTGSVAEVGIDVVVHRLAGEMNGLGIG